MELPGRMQVERKVACPHCRKLLPEFTAQEILESREYPLRCGECRRVVELQPDYIEAVRRSQGPT
jgi:DNA-directed RNA polymerase subunit RPC12/RpoP